jgi:FkbH-like protein
MHTASSSAPNLANVRELDPFSLDSVQVRRLSREIRARGATAEARIAYAGNVVFEPLPEFVEAHLACHGVIATTYIAPFDQTVQELLDPDSALHRFSPNFLVLHFELDAILPGPRQRDIEDGRESIGTAVSDVLGTITPATQAALRTTSATVLLTNFAGPDCYDLGIADSRSDSGQQELFAQLNLTLAREFRNEARVQVVDACRLTAYYGRGRARDRRLYYLAKMPWHEGFLPILADEICRHIGATLGRIRKCLALDLDNTLWGGVLAEEGPLGILVGPGDPVGEAHFDLQRRILALRRRGIVLAACSKNDPADVEEVFRIRTDMPLRRDDFVCMQIGWDLKYCGLQRIAETLNIGTDTLVFLDDNPAEIELVRQFLPEVECVLVPKDPAARPTCLDGVHGLDRPVITAEDSLKTLQYQKNTARESARREFPSLQGYLRSLRTRLTIETVSPATLPRAQQLFAKTNQFNVSMHRYSPGELEQFASGDRDRALIIRAADRFGELGWIGVLVLLQARGPHARIGNFVLSCRAMGREIETAVMNYVKRLCFDRFGCASLVADYVPTARNVPVRELYERQGFAVIETGEDGSKRYLLERASMRPRPCDWIALEEAAEWTSSCAR